MNLLKILSSSQLAIYGGDLKKKLGLGPCPFEKAFSFLKSAGQKNSVDQASVVSLRIF